MTRGRFLPRPTRGRERGALWAVVILVISLDVLGGRAQESAAQPVVYAATVDSVIHPVSAEFMVDAIDRADRAHASLLVFTLRTPGGLVDSTRDIVSRMVSAATPVAVFVAPAGARAASAGFILTIAADIAAMSPGTHIGAAHPVSGNGQPMDEVSSKKATEDVAAYTRTLVTRRHRNVDLAMAAVNESRAFTEQEASTASPPLVDLIVPDLAGLLKALHGREIRRFDGTTTVVHTEGARLVSLEMNLRQRVLSPIAHPNIAYLLLSLGMLGLTIELWSPGAILPGVVGGVSLLLAFFALQLLPVNYSGLLLILLGLLLLGLEIKVTSYGLLTIGGAISLIFGSMILIDAGSPELRLSFRFVLPVVIAFVALASVLVRLGIAAQRQPSVTGEQGMMGQTGETLTEIEPGRTGRVAVRGEIWQARSTHHVPARTAIRVVDIDGLTLTVDRV